MYGLTAKVHDWIVGHGTSTLSGLTLADLLLGQPANLLELVNGRFGVDNVVDQAPEDDELRLHLIRLHDVGLAVVAVLLTNKLGG